MILPDSTRQGNPPKAFATSPPKTNWNIERERDSLSDLRTLEDELRELLAPVQLICEAEISSAQVEAAERHVREALRRGPPTSFAQFFPATLATYFVVRGSELYTRNAVWEQLGVTSRTSEAGQAFLDALHALSLPDFSSQIERAGARRYVAPILIHGALPASVASRLVERLEAELRRGLVDGAEARRRLLRQSDIEFALHRPAVRLLEWCPAFADKLLDAMIDHIESPSGDALRRLPVHLRNALKRDAERRVGLKRLRTPFVEFMFWAGIGPEVVGVEGAPWVIASGDASRRLEQDDRFEVEPRCSVSASGAGRELSLWSHEEVTFFNADGRPIPNDQPLPLYCTSLLPRRWGFFTKDGAPIEEQEEGEDLSGAWSAYRSCGLSLNEYDAILVGPIDDVTLRPIRREVATEQSATLVGQICSGAFGPEGTEVVRAQPVLHIPGARATSVRGRFHPTGRSQAMSPLRELVGSDGSYSLDGLFGDASAVGTLEVVGGEQEIPVAFVPGLEVDVPQAVVGPTEATSIIVFADAGVLREDGEIAVLPGEFEVPLPVLGVAPGAITVPIPRVRWSLRSADHSRLEFADGVVASEPSVLTDHDVRLLVRCGRRASVGLRVVVDGVELQTIRAKPTSQTGPAEHSRSLALAETRETVRAHSNSHLRFDLLIDGRAFPAVECGVIDRRAAQRSWGLAPSPPPSKPDRQVFVEVPWLREVKEDETTIGSDRQLLTALRNADGADSVVTFLRTLGARQMAWRRTEFPVGDSAKDWASLDAVAHSLWGLTGVRHRVFSGTDPLGRLRQWGGTRKETWRKEPERARHRVEQWMMSTVPLLKRLSNWRHFDLLATVAPTKNTITSEWLPTTVLYHVLAVVGGEPESGPIVEEAVALAPALTLEAVAFVLEFLHHGDKVQAPIFTVEEDDEVDDHTLVLDLEPMVPNLASLADCRISVTGSTLLLEPAVEVCPPTVRLYRKDRPVALLHAAGTDSRFTVDVPSHLSGPLGLRVVDPSAVEAIDAPELTIAVSSTPTSHSHSHSHKAHRGRGLESLGEDRIDALVDSIMEDARRCSVAQGPVNELFDDEDSAAQALIRMATRGCERSDIERTAIAVLPAAFLFSNLRVQHLNTVAMTSRLLVAAIAPHTPAAWSVLGWPNSQTFHSRQNWTDLAGFIHRLGRLEAPQSMRTSRYAPSDNYANPLHLARTLEHAANKGVPTVFLDLVVSTHRALTVDRLTEEAIHSLLSAHRIAPDLTSGAVVAGIATVLSTTAS